jgi:hypothetical protein
MLFNAIHEVVQIVPPKVTLTNNGVIEVSLVICGLLVHTKMEMLRPKKGTNLINQVLTNLIIGGRGEHSRIILQPNVMTSREVKLRDKLKAHALQSFNLLFHRIMIPGITNVDFRMRFIFQSLGDVDNQRINACLTKVLSVLIPALSVEKKGSGCRRGGAMLTSLSVTFIIPKVGTEMNQLHPFQLIVFHI